MAFVKAGLLSQLPPDSVIEVMVDGNAVALCNSGGEIRAIDGICPHQGGPLGQGAMNGEHIVCPWHAWEFHSATGENDFDPETRVANYPVRIDGNDIFIDVA